MAAFTIQSILDTSVLLLYCTPVLQAKPAEKLVCQTIELILLTLLTDYGLVSIFCQPICSLC